MPSQVPIARVEKMPNIPSPFHMRDWRALARAYDAFVFDFDRRGDFLPLIWWDRSHRNVKRDTFGLPSYVGRIDRGQDGAQEAINCVAAVLGATLVGIDKSDQDGHNWALMCENYYNSDNGEHIFLNRTNDKSGRSFWYDLYTHVLIFSLLDRYPKLRSIEEKAKHAAEAWYAACLTLKGDHEVPDFDHTGFDFKAMQPVDNGRWREPEAAAGVAWLGYAAWRKWGAAEFLAMADWGMRFLEERAENPYYEILLLHGAYTSARMNAELGHTYDVEKLLNWCFDGDSTCRPGWGVIADNWGGYDCHGLCGSQTDGGGYAFAMNTFAMAGALVPLVRYDARFARAIGKWMLNAANNARLFYADFHPPERQSCGFWLGDPEHVIAYEGLRKVWDGRSPYATGDPIRYAWGAIDFGLYGSSHVGLFGGIIAPTDDPKILQLDCLATDFYRPPAYPTYLYYNPYDREATVEIDVGPSERDLYDAAVGRFVARGVRGKTALHLAPDSAAVVVIVPTGGTVRLRGRQLSIDGIVVDYAAAEGGA